MTEGGDQSDWDQSAAAWIAVLGEHGDYTRTHILDPVMCQRIAGRGFASTYMRLLLTQGLRLSFFDEPAAIDKDGERATEVRRRP